jgi:hypothetical protein
MKLREDKIPDNAKQFRREAGERIVKLYEASERADKAAEWRAKLQ